MGQDVETETIKFPPVVYVPCSLLNPADDHMSVDLRPARDGRLALLVYSALDRLVTCCGDKPPATAARPASARFRGLPTAVILPTQNVPPKESYVDAPVKELYEGPVVVVRTHPAEAIEMRRTFWGRRRAAERVYSFAIFGPMLAVDPAVAYHALRRYHAHSEAPDELVAGEHEVSPDIGYLTEHRPTLDDQVRPS
jgi:hypothetical protein